MSDNIHPQLLRRIAEHRPEPAPAGQTGDLTWAELAPVMEGLAFSQRPLRAATRGVTARYSLGPRGAFMLSLITNGICFPGDISLAMKIGRSLVTAELARLTDAGLVTARIGANDRRRSELALTPKGQAACDEVRAEMARIIRRNLTGYSRGEVELFARMLRDVRKDDAEAKPADVCGAALVPD